MTRDQLTAKGFVEVVPGRWAKSPYAISEAIKGGGIPTPHPVNQNGSQVKCERRRVRQSAEKPLNRLESEYAIILESRGIEAQAQAVRLQIANGVHYTPDFFRFASGNHLDFSQ